MFVESEHLAARDQNGQDWSRRCNLKCEMPFNWLAIKMAVYTDKVDLMLQLPTVM